MLIYGLNDYYFKIPIIDKESLNKYKYLFRVEKVEATRKTSGENYCKDQVWCSKENNYCNLKKIYTASMIKQLAKDGYEKPLIHSGDFITYNKFCISKTSTSIGKIINVWA